MREMIHKYLLANPGYTIDYQQLAEKAIRNDNIGLLNLIGGVTQRFSIMGFNGLAKDYSISVSKYSFDFNSDANPQKVNGYKDYPFYLKNEYLNGEKGVDLLLYSELIDNTIEIKSNDYSWINTIGVKELWPKPIANELKELSKNYILLGWYGDMARALKHIEILNQLDPLLQPYAAMYLLRALPALVPKYNQLYVDLKRATLTSPSDTIRYIVITSNDVSAYLQLTPSYNTLLNLFSFLVLNNEDKFKFIYFKTPQIYTNTIGRIIFDNNKDYTIDAMKILK